MTAITIDQNSVTVPQVLTGAKSLLLTAGWITDEMHSRYGYCLAGAVRYAAHNYGDETVGPRSPEARAIDMLVEALLSRGAVTVDSAAIRLNIVTHWNDHRCQGVDDAVALIDEALLHAAALRTPRLVRRSHLIKSLLVRRHTDTVEVPELQSVG